MKKFVLVLALLTPTSCLLDSERESCSEVETSQTKESEEMMGGWHRDFGPDPESCEPIHKKLPNGMIIDIPVECHPFIINPYYDDDWSDHDLINHFEMYGRPEQQE